MYLAGSELWLRNFTFNENNRRKPGSDTKATGQIDFRTEMKRYDDVLK